MKRSGGAIGFTLVEMLVALVLTALLALIAHATLTGLIDARRQATEAREALDAEMEGRAWVAAAVASVDVGAGSFAGTADSAAFTTWLPDPNGYLERRRAAIYVEGGRLILRAGSQSIPLVDRITDVRIDYLLGAGLDAQFVSNWESPVSAPLAIRLRFAREEGPIDTLLLLIGDRG